VGYHKKSIIFTKKFLDEIFMHQFLGNNDAKVDIKGRLFVPAFYRKSLEKSGEEALYLELDAVSKCVKLYPASFWKKRDDELKANLNLWKKEDLKLYRQFTSRVDLVELDSAGRVLIPKRYLDTIEVETEALFVGVGEYFEIWNRENFEKSIFDEEEFEMEKEAKMGNTGGNCKVMPIGEHE
jgi:MraZ protein